MGNTGAGPSTENRIHPWMDTPTVHSVSNQPRTSMFLREETSATWETSHRTQNLSAPRPPHMTISLYQSWCKKPASCCAQNFCALLNQRVGFKTWRKIRFQRKDKIGNGRHMSRCAFSEHWTDLCAAATPIHMIVPRWSVADWNQQIICTGTMRHGHCTCAVLRPPQSYTHSLTHL